MEDPSQPATVKAIHEHHGDVSALSAEAAEATSCPHTPTKKRTEFKQRVNHYLYDNLNRVLCELYFYCEHESNAIQCSEVLNILSQASLQFHQLNRQLILLSKTNAKNTKSISWNVSSLSPQSMKNRHSSLQQLTHTEALKINLASSSRFDADQDLECKLPEKENTEPNKIKSCKQESSPTPPSPTPMKKSSDNESTSTPPPPTAIQQAQRETDVEQDESAESGEPAKRAEIEMNDNHGYEQYIKVDILHAKQQQIAKQSEKETEKEEIIGTQMQTTSDDTNANEKDMSTKVATKDDKVAVKCWADLDSESDLDLESNNDDEDESPNRPQSVEAVSEQKDESVIIDVVQETQSTQMQDKVEPPPPQTQQQQESQEADSSAVEEKEETQEQIYSTRDANGRQQKWRKKLANTNSNEATNTNSTQKPQSPVPPQPATVPPPKTEQLQQPPPPQPIAKRQTPPPVPAASKKPTCIHKPSTSEDSAERGNKKKVEHDVWFSSQYQPVTLDDIMNEESQKLINKYEHPPTAQKPSWGPNKDKQVFPLAFNEMVKKTNLYVDKPRCEGFNTLLISNETAQNEKMEKLISRLSSNTKSSRAMNPNEQFKKTQLKQQKAEHRRLQFQEQQSKKWQIVAAKKRQKREELRKQTESKLMQQKKELNAKLTSAKLRYDRKIKEKKRRAIEYDMKIRTAAKEKGDELAKQRELQRQSQEEKMKKAMQRHKQTITKKQLKSSSSQNPHANKEEELNDSLILKKQKIEQKLKESEERRNEILKQIQQKSSENHDKTQHVLQRKKQLESKRKSNHKHRHKRKHSNSSNGSNNKKQQQSAQQQQQKDKVTTPKETNSTISSEFSYFSSTEDDSLGSVDENAMKQTLKVLLASSEEYIAGLKPKREWFANSPYSELKSSVQALCNKAKKSLNYLRSVIHNTSTSPTNSESNVVVDYQDAESMLVAMLNGMEYLDNAQTNNLMLNEDDINMETQLQNVLKVMDGKETCNASSSFLLMYLVSDIIELLPYLSKLSLRTQRLLLQCIVNATQKNRGVAQYIIRSDSCLYLLHLLLTQLFEKESSSEIKSMIHTLTIAINSIRDFPDLVSRKIHFYKYLTILKFFNKIVHLFGRIVSRCTYPCNKYYHLFYRVVPFIQSVTTFYDYHHENEKSDASKNILHADNQIIFDVIRNTNFYGLQSLISTLLLNPNENNKGWTWRKKKQLTNLRIVLSSFQSINNMARIDLTSFQQIINAMPIELYHVLSYSLSYLTFHLEKSSSVQPINPVQHDKKVNHALNEEHVTNRRLLHEVLLFMSYCCLDNAKFQQYFRFGDDKTDLINKLCQLPFEYFSQYQSMKILFPTLITCTYQNDANCKVLNTVLNKKHLSQFIIKTYHQKRNPVNKLPQNKKPPCNVSTHFELEKRFPIRLWRSAIQFYNNN